MTYKIQIDDSITDATTDEIAQIKAIHTEAEAKTVVKEARAAQKAALLDRLGISAEEAKLLLS